MCSDILTPLTALGVPFEIDDHKGPIIEHKITSLDEVRLSRCVLQLMTAVSMDMSPSVCELLRELLHSLSHACDSQGE